MSEPGFDLNRKMSRADIARIVSEELPHWKSACERQTQTWWFSINVPSVIPNTNYFC